MPTHLEKKKKKKRKRIKKKKVGDQKGEKKNLFTNCSG